MTSVDDTSSALKTITKYCQFEGIITGISQWGGDFSSTTRGGHVIDYTQKFCRNLLPCVNQFPNREKGLMVYCPCKG